MYKRKCGKLLLICGSMYASKTEELIRELKRYTYAKKNIQVFKPVIDNRYDNEYVVSHNGEKIKAKPIEDVREVMKYLSADTDIVGLDEVQFFDKEYTANVVKALKKMGINVICSGLDMTYEGQPFETVSYLLAIANEVRKLKAVCVDCGDDAYVSYRLTDSKEVIQVGAKGSYIAVCEDCFNRRIRLRDNNKRGEVI